MNSPLPLPLEAILRCPTLAVAGATVHGAVLSIVLQYWRAGCRGLPTDEAGLAALSRCYGAQWSRVRQPVMQALAEITPHLASTHTRMLRARQARQAIARKAGLAGAQKRREAKQSAASKMLAQPLPTIVPFAQRAAPHGNLRADMPALAQVAQRNAQVQRADAGGLLRDKGSAPRRYPNGGQWG